MHTSAHPLQQGKLKIRQLEPLAFHLGAHGVDAAPTLQAIDAHLVQQAAQEKEEPLRALHALEANLQQVKRDRPDAETVWQRLRDDMGEIPPPYFYALILGCFGLFSVAVDAVFLAPTMDILNIALPAVQFLAAFGVASLSTAWFEIMGTLYGDSARGHVKRVMAVAGIAVGVLSLVIWGLLRGYELRFAAVLGGSPLGDFLGSHPVLASLFFIIITVATPLTGAAALLIGWRDFSKARTWRRARKKFETLRASEIQLARKVESEKQHLAEFDRRKEAERTEWRAVFDEFYKRGTQNGARRETLRSVLIKSLLGGVLASPVALLVPEVFFGEHYAIPAVVTLACYLYFNYRRHHPTHLAYLKRENTRFAVIPDAPRPARPQAPPARFLEKGGGE